MDLSNVEIKINEIISDSEDRQIVMWYDESKEFTEEIKDINLKNAELFVLDDGVKDNHKKFQKIEVSIEGEKPKKINLLKNI